ncbi:sigma-70 family RNA polymerase sigma factor [Alkalibacterium sp. f15]|uniref:sigma-70 family RNA polymerase sigma factor n=1 Tax=Alkalibacterium sp. f15 TaxID=3414029 RepID=UPI003BF8003F
MQFYTEKEEPQTKKIYKDISDPVVDALIFQIQAGNDSVFPELIDRCESLLRKSTYRRFVKGYEREDLYQEACMILVECVGKYDLDRGMSFNQYVCLSLDNHFNRLIRWNNALKRKSFRDSISLEGVLEENGYQLVGPSKAIQPEDKPIVNETMEEYIEYLSSFEKEVCLNCFLGYSYDKIAADLNCSREKVMNAKHRCTEKYRKHFI